MEPKVSHLWSDESLEAKARWFGTLSDSERIEVFCEFIELLLELNPNLAEASHAEPTGRSVQIIERP